MSRAFVFLGEVEQGNLCAVASGMKKGANPNMTFIGLHAAHSPPLPTAAAHLRERGLMRPHAPVCGAGVLPLKLCVELANVDMACLARTPRPCLRTARGRPACTCGSCSIGARIRTRRRVRAP